jgi:hypothetical protein
LRTPARVLLVVSIVLVTVALDQSRAARAAPASGVCAGGMATPELNSTFSRRVTDYVGMDSLRAVPLPDGRVLWLMQDSFLTRTGDESTLIGSVFAHNAALVQHGSCFHPLHGPTPVGGRCGEPGSASYAGGAATDNCGTWFWPMGGALGADGMLHVFYVKMTNPNGLGAAPGAAPDGAWIARIDPASLDVVSLRPAPDPGGDILFGWTVETTATFSYLFGHSYDQFNVPEPDGAQPNETYLARVAPGRFDMTPEYWNGGGWTSDRTTARPVFTGPRRTAYAMQPRLVDGVWVSVTKIGDWFGSELALDTAPAPEGP